MCKTSSVCVCIYVCTYACVCVYACCCAVAECVISVHEGVGVCLYGIELSATYMPGRVWGLLYRINNDLEIGHYGSIYVSVCTVYAGCL